MCAQLRVRACVSHVCAQQCLSHSKECRHFTHYFERNTYTQAPVHHLLYTHHPRSPFLFTFLTSLQLTVGVRTCVVLAALAVKQGAPYAAEAHTRPARQRAQAHPTSGVYMCVWERVCVCVFVCKHF